MQRSKLLNKLHSILKSDKPDIHRINLFLLYLERSLNDMDEDKSKAFEHAIFKLLQRIKNENEFAFVELKPLKCISRL